MKVILISLLLSWISLAAHGEVNGDCEAFLDFAPHLPTQITQLIQKSTNKILRYDKANSPAKTKLIKTEVVALVSKIQTYIQKLSDDDIRERLEEWSIWTVKKDRVLPGSDYSANFPQTFYDLETQSEKQAGELSNVYANFVGVLSSRAFVFGMTNTFSKKDVDFTIEGFRGFYERLMFHEYVRRRIQKGELFSSPSLKEAFNNFDNEIKSGFSLL